MILEGKYHTFQGDEVALSPPKVGVSVMDVGENAFGGGP